MKRKEIRKILKQWVHKRSNHINGIDYIFVNRVHPYGSVKMSKVFESLVDEVDKMIRKEEV